jgi:hypothetical protein
MRRGLRVEWTCQNPHGGFGVVSPAAETPNQFDRFRREADIADRTGWQPRLAWKIRSNSRFGVRARFAGKAMGC